MSTPISLINHTSREQIATAAMQALIMSTATRLDFVSDLKEYIATSAIELADELISQLAKKEVNSETEKTF